MIRFFLILSVIFFLGFTKSYAQSWQYVEDIDLMTDTDSSIALIQLDRRKFVAVICRPNGSFDIFASVDSFLGGDSQRVLYRFDSDDPIDAGQWRLNTNSTAVFVPQHIKNELLNQIRNRDFFTIQITTFRGARPTERFPLTGSNSAISKLSCVD